MAGKSVEERLVLVNKKIEEKEALLQQLMEQRNKLLHPIHYRDIIGRAKELNITPLEMAEKLGFEF